MAEALIDICRHYLGYNTTRLSPRRLPHIAMEMTLEEYETRRGGRYQDGSPTDPSDLCDATISRVVRSGSTILDYGRTVKEVPDSLRRVVIHRDRHCRFEGCDRPPQWCQTHHHQPWDDGGHTKLSNLVLLCSRHHHLLHAPGWTSTFDADGTLTVTTPHGRILQTRPPP